MSTNFNNLPPNISPSSQQIPSQQQGIAQPKSKAIITKIAVGQISTPDAAAPAVTKKAIAEVKFANNNYIKALGAFQRGNEKLARKLLEEISKEAKKTGIDIDVEKSLNKMSEYAKKNPYTDLPTSAKKAKFESPKEEQVSKKTALDFQKELLSPKGSATSMVGANTKIDAKAVKAIDLQNLSDEVIFDKSIELPVNDIKQGSDIKISYSNVKYSGSAPDITIKFSSKLSQIHNFQAVFDSLEKITKKYNLGNIDFKDHTAISLIDTMASQVNKLPIPLAEKEKMIEDIIHETTIAFVGTADTADQYLLHFAAAPLARDYFNFASNGALLNAFFASVQVNDSSTGSMSTDLFIKQNGADCRGTNCIYGSLLNVGYDVIGSQKEAKALYVKVKEGNDPDAFNKNIPEDHNIVVVQDKNTKEHRVMDAFFSRYNNKPLREVINGRISDGIIVQVAGANPYPAEQFKTT